MKCSAWLDDHDQRQNPNLTLAVLILPGHKGTLLWCKSLQPTVRPLWKLQRLACLNVLRRLGVIL